MALRVPNPVPLRSTGSASSSGFRPASNFVIHSNLKQTRKGDGNGILFPELSPLQISEGFASRFGHEIAVLELERLFKTNGSRSGSNFGSLQLSGPSVPSTRAGFSGRPVRVAYQGVRGSYCQEAAAKAFPVACNAFPCTQMSEAFQFLEERDADRAIIPVENSIDGTIDRNFDLLLRHGGVEIVGELILPVNHCLLAVPKASRSDLKRIVSHPQALSHCKTKLQSLDLEIGEVANAADAARYVSENGVADTAVIGSKIAGKEFGLQVIEENFQDEETGNFNRFLQLGLEPSVTAAGKCAGIWKTTVAFSLENGVTDLFRALWVFESRNVPVTRVTHRPNRSKPVRIVEKETGNCGYLDYVFILDLEGSVSDPGLTSSLAGLKEISGFVRVLGSYTCGRAS